MHCTCHFVADRTSEDEAILPYTEMCIFKSSPTMKGRLALYRQFGRLNDCFVGEFHAMRAVIVTSHFLIITGLNVKVYEDCAKPSTVVQHFS
jgi:hypothetical protein